MFLSRDPETGTCDSGALHTQEAVFLRDNCLLECRVSGVVTYLDIRYHILLVTLVLGVWGKGSFHTRY